MTVAGSILKTSSGRRRNSGRPVNFWVREGAKALMSAENIARSRLIPKNAKNFSEHRAVSSRRDSVVRRRHTPSRRIPNILPRLIITKIRRQHALKKVGLGPAHTANSRRNLRQLLIRHIPRISNQVQRLRRTINRSHCLIILRNLLRKIRQENALKAVELGLKILASFR